MTIAKPHTAPPQTDAKQWFVKGEDHRKHGQLEAAVEAYETALSLTPAMVAARHNLGLVLQQLGRQADAVAAFEQVVAERPDSAESHFILGCIHKDEGRTDAALKHLGLSVKLKPSHKRAWNNLALICKNMGDLDRSLAYFNRALEIDPRFALAYWNRSMVLFLLGRWLEAWRDFEHRFRISAWRDLYPHRLTSTRWDGRSLPDQTILVHDEQGLGDTFQFIRYLPQVKARCAKVILETRKELADLLEQCEGVDAMVHRSPSSPPTIPHDAHVPLMSLPAIFDQTLESIPNPGTYIHPPQDKVAAWGQRLAKSRPTVGLVWAGRPEHANDLNRSIRLEEMAQLFRLDQIQFIGMQKGAAAQDAEGQSQWLNFENWGDRLESFADTAGLLANLDLVITVDTSVAHLAGAMRRPVWVLIPWIPDWRWMMTGQQTPWYPTLRLYRQLHTGDWTPVIATIRKDLAALTVTGALPVRRLWTDPPSSTYSVTPNQ